MGCSYSCMSSSPPKPKSKSIRIVHLNGAVEEIEHPITVAQVTGKQSKQYFIFTQAQLLAAAATPLKLNAPLEAGRVYFLLPSTLFQSNVSPVEFAPIARKLASISKSKSKSKSKSALCSEPLIVNKSRKSRSWKPILSTIRERSFNRRSESDLQAEEATNIHTKN